MHRPARRPLARESLVHPHLPAKRNPRAIAQGLAFRERHLLAGCRAGARDHFDFLYIKR